MSFSRGEVSCWYEVHSESSAASTAEDCAFFAPAFGAAMLVDALVWAKRRVPRHERVRPAATEFGNFHDRRRFGTAEAHHGHFFQAKARS